MAESPWGRRPAPAIVVAIDPESRVSRAPREKKKRRSRALEAEGWSNESVARTRRNGENDASARRSRSTGSRQTSVDLPIASLDAAHDDFARIRPNCCAFKTSTVLHGSFCGAKERWVMYTFPRDYRFRFAIGVSARFNGARRRYRSLADDNWRSAARRFSRFDSRRVRIFRNAERT